MLNDREKDEKLLSEIQNKKAELENNLKLINKYIYENETKYFENTQNCGNIIKGWEQYFCANPRAIAGLNLKKSKFSYNERVFSNSSYNNPYLTDVGLVTSQSSQTNQDNKDSHISSKVDLNIPKVQMKKKKIISLKKKVNSSEVVSRSNGNSIAINLGSLGNTTNTGSTSHNGSVTSADARLINEKAP